MKTFLKYFIPSLILILAISCKEEEKIATNFYADKLSVLTNETIQFIDQSNDEVISWQWDFGDSTASTIQDPTHEYKLAGKYTVKLTVNSDVESNIEMKEDYITVNLETSSFIDLRDNNTYNTVKIGNQWWMSENLNYEEGGRLYMNDEEYALTYGRLYYYKTALNVCPDGWHLPSKTEWEELIEYLGSEPGKKLKANSDLWDEPYDHIIENNQSGFSALPGGCAVWMFKDINMRAYFWSSSLEQLHPVFFKLSYYNPSYDLMHFIDIYEDDEELLFSVRCIKD